MEGNVGGSPHGGDLAGASGAAAAISGGYRLPLTAMAMVLVVYWPPRGQYTTLATVVRRRRLHSPGGHFAAKGSEEWCSTMRISPSGSLTKAQVLSTEVTLPLLSVRSALPMVMASSP